ncbi:MAG: hypothetical protein AMXMBFR83_02490 [Phycisphaerae bacterium]
MPDCLNDEQLEALAGGTLPESQQAALRAHLAECSACRQAFEEWQSNLPFAEEVRLALADGQAGLPAGEAESRARDTHRGSARPEPDLPPPRQDFISGYEILEQLHLGAQGVVYRAVPAGGGREVAIKFLHRGTAGDEATLRRFDREIELARGLNHPGIIRVRDRGVTSGGKPYYIMDYVAGLPLHHYVWDKRLALEEALEIFLKVCEAVNYAHQRGVIHRDLKPSNILVDDHGVPHVLDFGLAKHLLAAPESLLSITGQVFGTLPYMSPEQALGRGDEVDIRTDVYALGVILYQVLTGTFPYPVTGPIPEVIRAIGNASALPPARAWAPGSGVSRRLHGGSAGECPIDEELETILLRALAKEPDRRYPNVAALMDDLARYLRGQPIEARREAGFYNLTRTLARYKAAAVLTGIGAVLVSMFASVLAWMYREQVRISELAAQDRARAVAAQIQSGEVLLRLGDNKLEQGDAEEAVGQYLAALAIHEDLAAREPDNLIHREKVADTLMRLGDAEGRRGDSERMADYYRRFLEMSEQLAAVRSGRTYYERLTLARQRWALVQPQSRPAASRSAPAS